MLRDTLQSVAVVLALLTLPSPVFGRTHPSVRSQRPTVALRFPSLTNLSVDLNSDGQPEKVELLSFGSSRTIKIQFGDLLDRKITFTTKNASLGHLIPYDSDDDADLDLILAAGGDKGPFVVCINDSRANFHVATDAAGYACEIITLSNNRDPFDEQSLKVRHNERPLRTPSSEKVLLAAGRRFAHTATPTNRLLSCEGRLPQSPFLPYLRERGPPVAS